MIANDVIRNNMYQGINVTNSTRQILLHRRFKDSNRSLLSTPLLPPHTKKGGHWCCQKQDRKRKEKSLKFNCKICKTLLVISNSLQNVHFVKFLLLTYFFLSILCARPYFVQPFLYISSLSFPPVLYLTTAPTCLMPELCWDLRLGGLWWAQKAFPAGWLQVQEAREDISPSCFDGGTMKP